MPSNASRSSTAVPRPVPPPQQEADPRERRDKASPQQSERKPLFPNQVDPPPQRPYPATSDESAGEAPP